MIDLEKIQSGLQHCIDNEGCRKCPYQAEQKCAAQLTEDLRSLMALVRRDAHPWISVEDELPKDDTKHMVCVQAKTGRQSINMAWFDGTFWHGTGTMAGVTHWKPFPALPGREGALLWK